MTNNVWFIPGAGRGMGLNIAKAALAAGHKVVATGDYEEIMNKASCLSLLSNAVLVWNTIKIGNIVGQLRGAGEQIDDADLSRVSPLAHRHVIPNGTYFLNQAVGDPKE
jgi:NAD(P)-dependent dehydrogenase (short-subunit alcohol dehydrogenase family)